MNLMISYPNQFNVGYVVLSVMAKWPVYASLFPAARTAERAEEEGHSGGILISLRMGFRGWRGKTFYVLLWLTSSPLLLYGFASLRPDSVRLGS